MNLIKKLIFSMITLIMLFVLNGCKKDANKIVVSEVTHSVECV